MRLGELQQVVDVLEVALQEAQIFLNNNPHIRLESAHDNEEYRAKIESALKLAFADWNFKITNR